MSTENLDDAIKHYRQSWDLTQEQFAGCFGFTPRSVRRWESGAVKPRTKNGQKLVPCLKAKEDSMDRRRFFREALAASMTFAAVCPQPDLQKFTELISSETVPLSIGEELSIVEMLTRACWQLLPHQSNVVERRHLDYVCGYRQKLESWLENSPGSPIDVRLASAISEIAQVEAGLLYALKRPDEAEKAYQAGIKKAYDTGNLLLEAIGLTWLGNFLIDTGQPGRAVAPVEAARRKAEKGHATPLVRAWIAATEADAWANQREAHKCERALDRASELTCLMGIEQERYPVPYDHPWLFGYRGTVYAHLGRPSDASHAQSELGQGLASLDPAQTFRQWGFYNDLVIAHSLDKNVEEACHCARLAMNIAEQSKAPVYLQRVQDTTQQSLKSWRESPIVKNLMEEIEVAKSKLVLV